MKRKALKVWRFERGAGAGAILQTQDLEAVKAQVKLARQRISVAKSELENSLERSFSLWTLKRYLKKTVAAINALEND